MADAESELIDAIELHSVEGIAKFLDVGCDPRTPVRGKSLTQWLTEMYTRSDRFGDCLRLLLARGAVLDDPVIAPVLLDDADALTSALHANPALIAHRTTMVSAFTPLAGATLLHVAAEFGNVRAARTLVELGAEVDARAATDEFGLNGHTPLFHAVNSNGNRSESVMRLLLEAGAKSDVRLAGIVWGKGFDWETTLFDVTPISYAQFGLLPQMHRKERDTYANVRQLLKASQRAAPPLVNVPNRYLQPNVNSGNS